MKGDQYKRPTKETNKRDLQKRLSPRKESYLKEIYKYERRPIQETYKRDQY